MPMSCQEQTLCDKQRSLHILLEVPVRGGRTHGTRSYAAVFRQADRLWMSLRGTQRSDLSGASTVSQSWKNCHLRHLEL